MTTETRIFTIDLRDDVAYDMAEWLAALVDTTPDLDALPPFSADNPDNHRVLRYTPDVVQVLRGGGSGVGIVRLRRRFRLTIDELMCLLLHAVNGPIGVIQVKGEADESFLKMCHDVRQAITKGIRRHV